MCRYNDALVDLLKAKKDEEKQLTIKQDAKGEFVALTHTNTLLVFKSRLTTDTGIVFVQGATIQECASLEELIRYQAMHDV